MKKNFTLLIATLIFLSAGIEVWGQQGVLLPEYQNEQVTPRRGDAGTTNSIGYIKDKTNVNNEFGAGETATITDGSVAIPDGHGMHNPPSSIQLGSDYSQNIVINSYNAGGYASGVVYLTLSGVDDGMTRTVNPGMVEVGGIIDYTYGGGGIYDQWNWPGCAGINWGQNRIGCASITGTSDISLTSNPSISYGNVNMGSADGVYAAGATTIDQLNPGGSYLTHVVDIYLVNHVYNKNENGKKAAHWRTAATSGIEPYTSTVASGLDDGVKLLQTGGNEGTTPTASIGTAPTKASGLDPYKRPTTVAVSGVNTFDAITVKNLQWWYRYHNLQDQEPGKWCVSSLTSGNIHDEIATGCTCHDGITYHTTEISGQWNMTTEIGNTYLDAAVQLVSGASVCVKGSITDNTGTPGSQNTTGTDAIFVFPINGNNYSLLVNGSYDRLRMKHEGTNANLTYTAAAFPQSHDADIYLNAGTSPAHSYKGAGTLLPNTSYFAGNLANPAASTTTTSSIFGIYKNYAGFSNIHTTATAAGADNNPGVIEIGPATAGQDKFYVYSGGILKNFNSTCITRRDSIVVGYNNLAPVFKIDASDPLYILNDGDDCNAAIVLASAAVTTLNTGVTGATGTGDLHAQAHSYVNIQDDINFTAAQNNNVAFLSDAAYIKTKGFTYTGGTGNLTLWTKGTPAVCDGGHIFMDGAVSINNSGTKADGAVLFGTVPGSNTISIASCITPTDQAAFNSTALATNIQTRIQSDNDSVSITGLYTHTNPDAGALLVQGDRKVNFQQGATLALVDGTADVAIQSKNADVEFGNLLTYGGGITTDLFIDGETGVTFSGGSITQPTTATNVNVGIQSNSGTILFKGAPFAFDVTNTDYLQVWAGRNIDVRSALTYDDHAGTATHVHFFAKDSLLTNAHWGGAPVTFTVGNTNTTNTLTDWISGANMHTSDRVTFDYSNTSKNVDDLTLKSLGGNITMDRPANIAYDSKNNILLSAELDCAERNLPNNAGYNTAGTGGNRNVRNGNILLNDSFNIIRNNVDPGETDILAKYNIRTAMVTMDDQASTGNNTTIASHMGDVFLGYSAVADGKTTPTQSAVSYDLNRFVYKTSAANATGMLKINAGFDDQANANRDGGGNIYFTHIDATMEATGNHPTEISIPFSNEYFCGKTWTPGALHERSVANGTMKKYEHAGIIGGVGRCGIEDTPADYAPSQGPGTGNPLAATDTSLIYRANLGNLLVDAGLRGNIIMNQGTYLDFQNDGADAFFLTRSGDIDMRGQTNIDGLQSSVLFLASSEEADKQKTGICGCKEQQNNVYLQDLQQRLLSTTKGSIFIGADNNIKLQYGGLKNVGTQIDPFLSENKGYNGVSCGSSFHCDADTAENKARELILNFAAQGGQGGMGIVASDLIDIYKNTIYTGGNGPGMSTVPTYGTLHGESVAGYGLYIKSQGNKDNWTKTDFDVLGKCGRDCALESCKDAFLHQTARVTFHADARLYAENQRVYIGSPVLDIYGYTEFNTTQNKGSKTSIMIQTDSLIMHDSLIIDGKLTKFSTWSNLNRDMPVFKFGHQRFTPPYSEDPAECPGCYTHAKTSGKKANMTALDSIFVTFRNGASIPRLNTLVADHTVLSFLTDSFDHVKSDPVINAKFYTDTFKVRNHVELFKTADHTHDGHFELISEAQMDSKDYAGIYARHLHMEPIQPDCSGKLYSQLWMQDPALDVITTSTFGGFGTIHADVHVEIEAKLAPGYASLGKAGRCYEQEAGTLSMQNLRLDKGAEIHYSIGDVVGFDGEYTDCIDVEELTLYGSVNIFVEKRVCQNYEPGCYPIIRYNTVAMGESNLNNLKLGTKKLDGNTLSLDTSTPGVVYLCVGENATPSIMREIYIPQVSGVNLVSPKEYGNHYIGSSGNFTFTVKFDSEPPLKVTTGRTIDGVEEELIGTKNANGEYVYVIRRVQQNISLTFGPDYATDNVEVVDGKAVWSYGNTINIRVEKDDIASIYSITGQLVKRLEVPESGASIPMERGVYIVTLKDGSVHKVILK